MEITCNHDVESARHPSAHFSHIRRGMKDCNWV
jgi:hypothetical protein